jgi:hypothetical protein
MQSETLNIKMLSLWQPWASLIAYGIKKVETRHWGTGYRGLIAIHAAKRKVDADGHELIKHLKAIPDGMTIPYGAIVAIARLSDCSVMAENNESQPYCYTNGGGRFYPSATEEFCGYWERGRYAWFLRDVRSIEPIYTNGKQGFPTITDFELLAAIEQRLGN